MSQTDLLRLSLIQVDGLFNIYTHRIELNINDRVTLLHGPNGVGKTVILRMTNALLRNQLGYFKRIPFSRFLLGFRDGTELSLEVQHETAASEPLYVLRLLSNGEAKSSIVDWRTRPEAIAADIDHLRPYESMSNLWRDTRDGEILTSTDVVSRYERHYAQVENGSETDMSWFSDFLKIANTHLIEAQRLVRTDMKSTRAPDYAWIPKTPTLVSTVTECSDDFRSRLADTMALYGRQSQALDQSFPQRLLSATEELSV